MSFPDLEIPDFYKLSKSPKWDPEKYLPMVYNERIKRYSEDLKQNTLSYDDFWEEMDYYCLNGIQPRFMPHFPGRNFYYTNFTKIEAMPKGGRKKVLMNPFYRDLDHWLGIEADASFKYGYGQVITKPRRVGLSEWGSGPICNYELTFFQLSKIACGAGKDDKIQEFYQKLKSSLNNTHEAYRNGRITVNDKELKLGFSDTINKQTVELGIKSLARFKTMYADTGAFEGGSYSVGIFEEIGLFENLTMSYKATEPCFRDGHTQFGIPFLYGTGGEIDKGAKGMKEIWENNETYNLKRIFIPANFYYPGDGVPDKNSKKIVSFFDHRTGVTNRELAKKYITEERKKASKSKDTYVKHVQSYPLLPSEVFLKTKGGLLDLVKLAFQLKEINNGNVNNNVMRGRLEWVDSPHTTFLLQRAKNRKESTKIRIANESKVKFVVDEEGYMFKDGDPINQNIGTHSYKPDIGGCDSYDEEVSEEKIEKGEVSSGCIMAYRTFSGPLREFNKPIGYILLRGDGSYDDDIFYEKAVMFSIYWDIKILIEYTKFHIMRYFYDVGAGSYVKERPEIQGVGENHKNKDGQKMGPNEKKWATKILKQEVSQEIHKYSFEGVIIDLMKYGESNTDIAMALVMCLFFRMSMFDEITDGIEYGESEYEDNSNDLFSSFANVYVDFNGNLKVNNYEEKQIKIQKFIPERDLSESDYKNYISDLKSKENKFLEERKKFEKTVKEDGIEDSILKLIIEEGKKLNGN